jgi:hypothetical protein
MIFVWLSIRIAPTAPVSSIAAFETYRGGAGYTAAKHAGRAITRTLRLELLGRPVRVTEIDPGHVETEFALVRFDGDAERAADLYRGFVPLSPEDVADCIAWAVTRPPHVNVDEIVVRSISQATAADIPEARPAGEIAGQHGPGAVRQPVALLPEPGQQPLALLGRKDHDVVLADRKRELQPA